MILLLLKRMDRDGWTRLVQMRDVEQNAFLIGFVRINV